MLKTLIIGYGNPLRGDDGIGIRAAELLAGETGGETPPLPDGVEVIACHQLSVELAAAIAEAERLILIDACVGDELGAIREQPLTPMPPQSSSLSHHLDARGLLAAAQMLYGKAPPTILLTVSGGDFGYSERLSPPVAAALPGLLARIRANIAQP